VLVVFLLWLGDKVQDTAETTEFIRAFRPSAGILAPVPSRPLPAAPAKFQGPDRPRYRARRLRVLHPDIYRDVAGERVVGVERFQPQDRGLVERIRVSGAQIVLVGDDAGANGKTDWQIRGVMPRLVLGIAGSGNFGDARRYSFRGELLHRRTRALSLQCRRLQAERYGRFLPAQKQATDRQSGTGDAAPRVVSGGSDPIQGDRTLSQTVRPDH